MENCLFNFYLCFFLFCICIFLFTYVTLWFSTNQSPNLYRSEIEKSFFDANTNVRYPFPSINSPPTVYLSVIIPAYNEELRLSAMMDETLGYLTRRTNNDSNFTFEIIIVDDGSKDSTSKVALKYCKEFHVTKVRLLRLEINRGKGGAVRLGMLSARGKVLLFADADGATKFADIEKLESNLRLISNNYNILGVTIGSRAIITNNVHAQRTFVRNLLMQFFHSLVWIMCVKQVKDTQCGFKLFTRNAAARLFPCLHVERWAFDVELLYIAQQLKIPIGEVPVNWREIDGSHLIPFWSWAQMAKDIFLIRIRYVFRLWNYHINDNTKTK